MSGRGKGKAGHAFPGDFIALGSKPGSSKVAAPPPTSHSAPAMVKKVKAVKGHMAGQAERSGHMWEAVAVEIELGDLAAAVEDCASDGDVEKAEGLLCGAVKTLRSMRAKPDTVAWLSLLSLAKQHPLLFSGSDLVREALCSLLKRDVRESFKSKGNCLVSVLSANVLYTAYQDICPWPEQFLRVYIEDAMGERLWVDQVECKLFTDNILTAFNTILPPTVKGGEEGGGLVCPSPPTGSSSGSRTPTRADDEVQIIELPINKEPVEESGVVQRYSQMMDYVEQLVVNIVKEQLTRRSQGQGVENITRNFIRFLTFACGLGEVRQVVTAKLEMWLMNPKISRSAQELLRGVTLNCVTHSAVDVEVMVLLTKLRLKTKPNITLFLSCLRDLCAAHQDNLATLLKHTIFNELSNARNTNNMAMLGVMFQTSPDKAAAALASVFLELLLQKDCYLRALRILLKEIVRCLRHDINLPVFCHFLMNSTLREKFEHFKEFEFKERMFSSLVDLVTVSIFLSISPAVREGLNAVTRGERKDITAYKNFLLAVSTITRDAVWWLHDVVPKLYKPDPVVYTAMLYKTLFMAPNHEEYHRLDGWPAEGDRGLFFKLTSEVPVQQEAVLRIFLIGLSKTLPLNGQDCLTIVETLIKRAAGLHTLASKDFPILSCDKAKDFMECVWQLTAYTYPESITLPTDYQPPSMAITASYWKAWQMLLIMTAYNPEEFGTVGWESYPTLRALMEMCITSQFVFPPPTIACSPEKVEEVKAQELQLASLEKQQILEFESQLAAASSKQVITEQSSLLLATITSMNPLGPLRRPPQAVLDQLKQMNTHYKLGHLLCRSRQPDFLLDILQRQGTNQAMPWLADLVESSEGSFSVLPVQCLCEFLLNDALAGNDEEQVPGRVKKRKAGELLNHLQQLLQNPSSEPSTCLETLDYFLARLSSMQSPARQQALSGLRLLLTPGQGVTPEPEERMEVVEEDSDWLLRHLPALPCFSLVYRSLANSLRQACQVECDPTTVSLYIRFLSQTCPAATLDDLAELALDMATVIVERSSLLPAILPGSGHIAATPDRVQADTYLALLRVFYMYMLLVRQQDRELDWSESQDLINVIWVSGESATLHILVVHAQIILLTYGTTNSTCEQFTNLLLMWFPPGQELPRAYLVDTSEEALLIPDWLKLKMIRSSVSVLVDSALRDLDPQQLVLFIQSFGIPVDSMSKLLQTLDTAVEADLESVNESVLDKAYMGQLVAVQHNRGATGGLVFAERLGLSLDLGGRNSEPPIPTNILPALTIPPRSTAMIPSNQVKATLLHLYDVGSPSRMNTKEKQDTFRTLQKFLTTEISSQLPSKPMLEATVAAIQSILQSDLGSGFVTALSQRTSFSVGLFRLLSSALATPQLNKTASAQTLLTLAKKLLKQFSSNKVNTPMNGLLQNYVKEMEPKGEENVPKKVLSLKGPNLEEDIKKMAFDSLKRGDTTELVSKLSSLLLKERETSGTTSQAMSQAGLLVDWLELLDPTVISTCPDLQQQLVFGRTIRKKAGASSGPVQTPAQSSRPYLLSLLTHQASWSVLRSTVNCLLATYQPELEPSAVLDFLSACIHIPRLWQGRDQRPPKHDQPPDVLGLEGELLESLTEYVMAEAVESDDKSEDVVKGRMDLVLRCLSTPDKIATVTSHLLTVSSETTGKKTVQADTAKTVLLEVYMKIPGCFTARIGFPNLTPSTTLLASLSISGGSESVVDCYTHTLLSALSATQTGKQWTVKMHEFELCARKLMSSHPILFLRNLPLLASSLQGRTHFEFPIFRSRNHLTLYTILLGLMELSRPHIFLPRYSESLEAALSCYVDMFQAYFQRRDSFIGVIDRCVQLLASWQEAGGQAGSKAASFLRKHSSILLRMHSAPSTGKLDSLKSLMSTVSLHGQTMDSQEQSLSSSTSLPHYSPPETIDTEIGKMLTDLSSYDSTDRLLTVLQEIQSASLPKPVILIHFQEELVYHLTHASTQVRSSAYNLVLRHLKHRPDCWSALLPGYMAALECGEEGVVDSALNLLPEFAVLGQENVGRLLSSVFKLGIFTNINTTQHITSAISMLNMQAGNS
eukprot:GFUD01017066.1.p1 GENE.GFUD01017066.1~~GFUD01017066.1.p1  ORF type:complete len:2079 (+),score=577.03 GFUD01017066.1:73-6309(+)